VNIAPGNLDKWKDAPEAEHGAEGRPNSPARRHFFLFGAGLLVVVMLIAGALRMLFPTSTVAQAGAGPHATQVAAVSAANRSFTDHIEALGTAKGQQSVNLSANSTELITAVHFQDGAYVHTGQVLVDLKSTAEQADVTNARAAVDVAQSNYNRYNQLAGAGFLAPAALDQYRAALRQAQASLRAAQSRQQDRVIRAPFSGRLGMTDIAPGTLISPGATIVTLDDTAVMRVDFSVPDRYLPALTTGASIDARPDPYPNRVEHGRVALVDTRIDPNTHAIRARADFTNEDGLLVPGMLMHIAVENGQRSAIALPESAVQTEGDETFVYVIAHQNGKTIARQTQVQVGANEGGYIEITSGVAVGAQVVADGLTRVQPDAPVRVVGAHGGAHGGAGGGPGRPSARQPSQQGGAAPAAPQDGLRATQP
jgi:membrane fusion protein (multidrug efflux system)